MRCPPPFQPPRPLNRPEPSRGIRTVEACDSNTLEPLPSLLLFISLSRRLRGGLMSFSAYGLTRSRQLRQARTCYLVAGWKSSGIANCVHLAARARVSNCLFRDWELQDAGAKAIGEQLRRSENRTKRFQFEKFRFILLHFYSLVSSFLYQVNGIV